MHDDVSCSLLFFLATIDHDYNDDDDDDDHDDDHDDDNDDDSTDNERLCCVDGYERVM